MGNWWNQWNGLHLGYERGKMALGDGGREDRFETSGCYHAWELEMAFFLFHTQVSYDSLCNINPEARCKSS